MGLFLNFNPKQKTFVILIVLVVLIVLLENLLPFSIVAPLQKISLPVQASVYKTKNDVQKFFLTVLEIRTLRSKNQELERDIAFLRAENAKLLKLEDENKILRDQLGVKSTTDKFVLASIVGEDPVLSSSRLILDKGSREGVKIGSIVFVRDILIGQISNVGDYSSTVRLLTDPETKIVAITQSGVQGLVQGEFGNRVVLDQVAQNKTLKRGEIVFTSGGSGLPKGMLIGSLDKIESNPAQLFQRSQITPLIDPRKLEIMFISIDEK